MAVIAGALAGSPQGGLTAPTITASLSAYAVDYYPPHVTAMGASPVGTLVPAFPVSAAPRNLAGSLSGRYSDDFYHRVHVLGGPIAAGNVTSPQDYVRTLWNAYLTPQQLLVVNVPEGVTVTPGPRTFAPLQDVAYTIHIEAEGPPLITGAAAFTWDAGTTSRDVPLSGSRVLSWAWLPDWSSPVLERLEWKTDVLPLADGAEQRIDLRLGARRVYEFSVGTSGMARRHLEAALWDAGAKVWALPLWHDTRHLPAALPAGAGAVPADTAHSEFLPGTSAVLLGDDPRRSESVVVAGVTPTHVLLAGVTTMDWPAGTRIVPTRAARLDGAPRFGRFTGEATAPLRLRFELVDPWDGVADPSPPLHLGAPVLELRPDWGRGLDLELARDLEQLDALVGKWSTFDRTGLPVATQALGWTFADRAQLSAYRRLLALQRGRLRALWVPTWMRDFELLASITPASTTMTVAWSGYALHLQGEQGRRDIRIELRDGTVAYARIASAVELNSEAEQLTLTAPVGITATPGQVAAISFMSLCRNNADAAEISHWTGEVAQSSATYRSFRE